MAAIYSNGGNRWNILGFNFTKRDALSSVYKICMGLTSYKIVNQKHFSTLEIGIQILAIYTTIASKTGQMLAYT
jgi:hypothetical protein